MMQVNTIEDGHDLVRMHLGQACARGYCHAENSAKILDADLIFAMVEELLLIWPLNTNKTTI
jgi:hypothetical protein